MHGAGTFEILTTTLPDGNTAEKLSRLIIENNLAACVQHTPVQSTYKWQNRIEESAEVLLTIKTAAHKREELISCIKSNHPYDLPEIIITPVIGGSDEYLEWISEAVT